MRRFVQRSLMVLAGMTLIACGGAKTKGESGDQSSYEQLAAMSGDIDQSVTHLMSPIDRVDAIVTALGELPSKYQITADEARELVRSSLTGTAPTLPDSLGDAGKAELQSFLTDLASFKDALVQTPDNAAALGTTLGTSLVNLPALVGKVSVESASVKANPLASKEDKARAAQQEADAKQLEGQITTKIKDAQTQVAEIPGKAQGAIAKFVDALGKLGIDNADAFLKAGEQVGTDAQSAAEGVVDSTAGAATSAVEAVTEGAVEAAETAVEGAEKAAEGAVQQ